MRAHQVPPREIRNFIQEETKPPKAATIDVWWVAHNWAFTILLPGQFSPYATGRVLCDGDMEIVLDERPKEIA